MKYYLLLIVLVALVAMAFGRKEKPLKFKYCRVEVLYENEGAVVDAYGTIVFREDAIIMRSNNDGADVIFVIDKEVAPEIDHETHKAWLVYNTVAKDTPLILELGIGDGVKILEPETGMQSFFFAVEREKDLQPLPERNVWYQFPREGGDLQKIKN